MNVCLSHVSRPFLLAAVLTAALSQAVASVAEAQPASSPPADGIAGDPQGPDVEAEQDAAIGADGPGQTPTGAEGADYQYVVVGTRSPRRIWTLPFSVSIADEEALVERAGATVGDLIDEEVGVHVQTTNRGAGAPIMRGQIGPGNLIVFDGIRFNNGTFRTGPNQYLNLFDPFALERIEILRGAHGVVYGSDAIGGIVHLIPRRPVFGHGFWSRDLVRLQSADHSVVVAPEVGWSSARWGVSAGYTGSGYGELTTGAGPVAGTDYRQHSARATLGVLLRPETELRLSYFGTLVRQARRLDRLEAGNGRVYDNDHHLVYARLDHLGGGAFEHLSATTSLDWTREEVTRDDCEMADVYGIVDADGEPIETSLDPRGCLFGELDAIDRVRQNLDEALTVGLALSVESDLPIDGLMASWGVDAYQSFVDSSRSDRSVTATGGRPGLAPPEMGRGNFSDDSTYGQFGAYVLARYALPLGEVLRLTPEVGGRLSHIRAAAPDVPGVGDVDYAFTGVTGSARLALTWPDKGILFTGWSQGFRAPNLQETTQLGDTGNFFEVPNASLGPERSDELEVGGRLQLGPFGVGASAFYSRVHDVISRREATFQGQTSVDGAPVRQRFNADRASYLGVEAELRVDPLPWLGLRANLTWIEGDVDSDGETEPARRAPPLQGLVALRYSHTSPQAFAELRVEAAADQDRLNSGDLSDLRICGSRQFPGVLRSELGQPCEGTPGWVTVGLRGGVSVSDHLRVTLDLANLFDERYRHHGSGIDEPGYNAAVTAEVGW